ncbi:N-acetylmuramoyl-L-alanine amidase [Clostridium tepidum]
MKIGIDCGHTMSGADYGSKGVLRDESYLTREVGVRVANKLKTLGHTVINCYKDTCSSLNDSLSYRVNTANNNNVDLYVSIHFNAFNGNAHGTEVLTYGGKSFEEASRVLNNIVSLGYANRGIKDGSNLYVIRNTKSKAMLIECCFCDNSGDMSKFNADKMADAIVKGLTGQTVNTNTTNTTKSTNNNSDWINLDGKTGTCTGDGVRIRDVRNRDKILGYLYKGNKVNLFRKEGDWIHIYFKPHGGYVYSKYIKYV